MTAVLFMLKLLRPRFEEQKGLLAPAYTPELWLVSEEAWSVGGRRSETPIGCLLLLSKVTRGSEALTLPRVLCSVLVCPWWPRSDMA